LAFLIGDGYIAPIEFTIVAVCDIPTIAAVVVDHAGVFEHHPAHVIWHTGFAVETCGNLLFKSVD